MEDTLQISILLFVFISTLVAWLASNVNVAVPSSVNKTAPTSFLKTEVVPVSVSISFAKFEPTVPIFSLNVTSNFFLLIPF